MMLAAIANEIRLSMQRALNAVAHQQHDANMHQRENGKGVAEGAMNHVPQIEDTLRAAKKQDVFAKFVFLLRYANGALQFLIAGRKQPETRKEPSAKAQLSKADARGRKRALEIDCQHGNERAKKRGVRHLRFCGKNV